jgi:Tol biopolymer transport system component
VVSALGGAETRIADQGRRPRFSPDGRLVAYYVGDTVRSGGSVYVVAAGGGQLRRLGTPSLRARAPVWSPDGTHLLCQAYPETSARPVQPEWIALPLDGGPPVVTGAGDALAGIPSGGPYSRDQIPAAMLAGGRVVFSARRGDSTNVWRLTLSPRTWQVTTPPEPMTFGTGLELEPAALGERLFFVSAGANVDLWSLPLARSGEAAGAPSALTQEPGQEHWPSTSADGRRVAFLAQRSSAATVKMLDLDTRQEIAVTVPPARAAYPRIAADGSQVVYLEPTPVTQDGKPPAPTSGALPPLAQVPRDQRGALRAVSVGPGGQVGVARTLCEDCARPWDWSRDGRYLAIRGEGAILLLDVATGALTPIASHATAGLFDLRFSPDDEWVTFTMNPGALRRRIVIAPFRGPALVPESEWITVVDSETLDRQATWFADGGGLYFQSDRDGFRCVWAQRLDPRTRRPLGPAFAVQHFHSMKRSIGPAAIPDPGAISLAVARGLLVMSLGEMTGNIWMTTP